MSEAMSTWAHTVMAQKYLHPGETTWEDIARRVVTTVMDPTFPELTEELLQAVIDKKFMPGGRYLYATGKRFHQTQNCLMMKVEDSRESISKHFERVSSGLMTGAGIGTVWSALREEGAPVKGMGGVSTGPIAFMQSDNEIGRHVMQGGARRAALWAGLHWNHPDIFKFIVLKNWDEATVAAKAKNYNAIAPMDGTNISVILDTAFFKAYEDEADEMHRWAHKVYWMVVEQMLTTAEPGFSIDAYENEGENLRNACAEVTSFDDNDICNLGSINLANISTLAEMERIVQMGTAFLIAGTIYSTVPFAEVAETREKNRRLGLGLMGMYEWLVSRGYKYEPNVELGSWLLAYEESDYWAKHYATRLGISIPVKTRSIAPTGTIGILAETTTGIEPLFAVAMKRRYLKGQEWHYQFVIDATAQRLMEKYNLKAEDLETAYDLAKDPERRIAFQAWVQTFVDHGISSTLNLPAHAEQAFSVEEFGTMLLDYLPSLRGVTCYPDGSRGGQPLNVVPFSEAEGQVGIEFAEFGNSMACLSGTCGI